MAKLLKLRRGTTSQHSSFTGAEGEVTIDTTKDTAVVHDGSQAGGRPLAREDLSNVSANNVRDLVENATNSNTFNDADHSKLNGIESGATADQTAAEIRALVQSASNSQVFTDADHTKLNGIESGATADQTASEIVSLISGQTIAPTNINATGKIGRDSTDYITFTNNNRMDVYINNSNEFRFESDGDFHADGDVVAFSTTTASDSRLKSDIHTINDALGTVGKLRGVSYKWLRNGQKDIGVIAQEVEEVVPEVVKTKTTLGLDGEEEMKTVDYGKLVGVLINAINELKAEVEELKGGK